MVKLEFSALRSPISHIDKKRLFRFDQDYDEALIALVVKHLNKDTGLDFGYADITRFGDLELLVFPTLDDLEKSLLDVSWADVQHALVARFNPMQVQHFCGF